MSLAPAGVRRWGRFIDEEAATSTAHWFSDWATSIERENRSEMRCKCENARQGPGVVDEH